MPPTKRVRKPSSRVVPVPPTVAKRKQKRQTPKEVATPGIEATNTQGCSGRETRPDHEVGRAMDQTSGCIGDVSTGDTGAGSSGTASAGVLPTGGNADSAIPVQDAEALITQPEAADQQKSPDLLTLGWTPVKQDVLREMAEQYPNQETAQELVKGFKEGFSLNYNGQRIPLTANNLKSVKENLNIAKTKIGKEVALGRVAGPFDNPPMSHFRISPIGLVPKSTEGDFRVIHHLSYPEGESVNDYIDLAPVHYASFDKAVDMIHNFGKGALLAKADIKSAFRLMIVSPSDFDLLGFSLDGKFYFDKCLPMGCSISCSLFEKFSTFIEWAVKEREKSGDTMHYLDDFLFCGKPASDHCSRALKTFCDVCTELGVPIAGEKTVYPTTKLVFLGLELDSDTMSIRIPEDKVQKAMEKIGNMINSTKVRLFEMQALVGYLNFLCKALPPGRTFLRRLINSMMGKKKHHRIRVNRDIKADLRTWMVFLTHFNGTAIMRQRWWETNDKLQFFTDSAGGQTLGFGIFFQNSWACETWPSAWMEEGLTKNITVLEYFPIVVALEIWGKQLKNKKVLFQSDNQAVVQIINSMTSKCDQVMTLVRHMVLLCLEMNITVRGQYIKGKSNEIADSLSRFQMAKFHTLAPQAPTSNQNTFCPYAVKPVDCINFELAQAVGVVQFYSLPCNFMNKAVAILH